jgi:hypothetical protein
MHQVSEVLFSISDGSGSLLAMIERVKQIADPCFFSTAPVDHVDNQVIARIAQRLGSAVTAHVAMLEFVN